ADGGVLGAADREERPESPLLAVRLEPRAPLERAVVVADALAGGDQIAAGEADQDVIGELARDDRRADLVELAHPRGYVARGHLREPVQRPRRHLVVRGADRLADADGFVRSLERPGRIAALEELEHAFAQREPRVLGSLGKPLEEPARAAEPSA